MYIRYMWLRREKLGLEEGAQLPVLKEVKKFLGAGAAVVFRQVNMSVAPFLNPLKPFCFSHRKVDPTLVLGGLSTTRFKGVNTALTFLRHTTV